MVPLYRREKATVLCSEEGEGEEGRVVVVWVETAGGVGDGGGERRGRWIVHADFEAGEGEDDGGSVRTDLVFLKKRTGA